MDDTYRKDYAELDLPEQADWQMARASYRQLVNRWHPDRYVHSPRERAHAETRFIRLAGSFNRLRQYYRDHHCLPLERPGADRAHHAHAFHAANDAGPAAANLSDSDFDPDVLHRQPRAQGHPHHAAKRPRIWVRAGVAIALVILTLGTVTWIDRNERVEAEQASQEALENAPRSDYVRSGSEIRNSSTRGKFIERQNGPMGDQLMPNVFR